MVVTKDLIYVETPLEYADLVEEYLLWLKAGKAPVGSVDFILGRIATLNADQLNKVADAVVARKLRESIPAKGRGNVIEFPTARTKAAPAVILPEADDEALQEKAAYYQERLSLSHRPSNYQTKILEAVETGLDKSIVCGAVAGSGKSTLIKWCCQLLQKGGLNPAEIRVIVFGKANSRDLIEKLGIQWVNSIKTVNALGFQILQRELGKFDSRRGQGAEVNGQVDRFKYEKIARELNYANKRDKYNKGILVEENIIEKPDAFLKLLDFVRYRNHPELVTDSLVCEIVSHFGVEGVNLNRLSELTTAIYTVLNHGIDCARERKIIDFIDQIWLPVVWKLNQCQWWQNFKMVCVDEAQDLNPLQRSFSQMLVGDTGRSLYVGDAYQAIMGFAGSDDKSYQAILEDTHGREMPLSVCYRCPSSHIELVNELYPEIAIEAAPNAVNGKIEVIKEDILWEDGKAKLIQGDLVVCRKTAPLVSLCIKLIRVGVPAKVKGREIGKILTKDIEAIAKMPHFAMDTFLHCLRTYQEIKSNQFLPLDNGEELTASLRDRLDAISAIFESHPVLISIQELKRQIELLFSDEDSPITLSTVHRAKGLEAQRVYIVEPESMPMSYSRMKDWQIQQEENLHYVALTRSKGSLFIVLGRDGKTPDWVEKVYSLAPEVEL